VCTLTAGGQVSETRGRMRRCCNGSRESTNCRRVNSSPKNPWVVGILGPGRVLLAVYVLRFVGIVQPLNQVITKGVQWQLTLEEQLAFDHLKDRLVEHLSWPNQTGQEVHLERRHQWLQHRAVLFQVYGGTEVVVTCHQNLLGCWEELLQHHEGTFDISQGCQALLVMCV